MVHKYCYHQYNVMHSSTMLLRSNTVTVQLVQPQHFSSTVVVQPRALYPKQPLSMDVTLPCNILLGKKKKNQRTTLIICFKGLSKIDGFVFALLLIQVACFWILMLLLIWTITGYWSKNTVYAAVFISSWTLLLIILQ